MSPDRALLRLTAGRARASELAPYFSSALFAMKPVATPGLGSYAVDPQWRLYWDPEFCESMTVDEGAAVWLHEVGHLLREHADRFAALLEPDERRGAWNRAGDAAINVDLREAGVALPPVQAVFPEGIAGGTRDMSTEQLYRLLATAPAGTTARTAQPPALRLHPPVLPPGADTVLARARERVFTGSTTVTVLDAEGRAVPGALAVVGVAGPRSLTLRPAGPLRPGRYTVVLTTGPTVLSAPLTVPAPAIRLRPDRLARGWRAPARVVVEASETRFDAATTVEVLDALGDPVPGAVGGVELLSPTGLVLQLGALPDGLYGVRVTAGPDAPTAVLPVGLPALDVVPAVLPGGFAAPAALTGVLHDLTADAGSSIALHDLAGPLAGAVAGLGVDTPTTVRAELRRTLPDGPYAVVLDSGGDRAVGLLTVGGTDAGSGTDDGDGEGQGSGPDGGEGPGDAPPGPDCGSGAGGRRRPWETGGEDTGDGSVGRGRAERIRQDVAREIAEHAADPGSRGSVPGGWLRWADAVLHPSVDWRQELNAVVRRTAAHVAGRRDYSYARPSRRASAVPGVVLPAMRTPRPPRCVVVLDTSGSMDDDRLARCLTEIDAVLARVRGERVEVIACDSSAADAQAVRSIAQLTLVGGGGTDLRVGLAAAAARRPRADLVITLTDGHTPWPAEPPEQNRLARYVAVLVAGPSSGVPSWMHTITVDAATAGTLS